MDAMRRIIRAWLLVPLLLVPLLLGGCSALRLTYAQAPHLVYWWLDRHLALTEEQAPQVRDAIAQWFAWHRREALPHHAQTLARLQAGVMDDTTPEAACRWWDEVLAARDAMLAQALPHAARLAVLLQPAQVDHLQRRLARTVERLRKEYAPADPQARQSAMFRRTVERAERIYGRLDEAQRQWLAARLAASPWDAQRWLAGRERRHEDLVGTLRELISRGAGPDEAQAVLAGQLARWTDASTPESRAFQCELSAGLHNLTTPAQRRTAQDRFAGWAADLQALADGRSGS
jgi:hypothetical protein